MPLLARWHQWRRAYTHERGLARVSLQLRDDPQRQEDEFEALLMATIEEEVERLPRQLRLAVQYAARAECLGAAVWRNPRLPEGAGLDAAVALALAEVARRLKWLGLL